jgi:hypothetical protein
VQHNETLLQFAAVTFEEGKYDELLSMAEPSLEGCGAWGEAVYASPSLRFVQERKSKSVTCKFNITGAKLCIY